MAKKNKNKNQSGPIVIYKAENVIAYIYLILMFAVFPLFYRNNYINITASKLGFFSISTIATGVILLLTMLFKRFTGGGVSSRIKERPVEKAEDVEKKPLIKRLLDKISLQERFIGLFAITVLISWLGTLLLDYPEYEAEGTTIFRAAFDGSYGKQAGAYFFFVLVLAFIIVSKLVVYNEWIVEAYLWVNMIVFGLAILNHFMIDPLHMYENLVEDQYWMFISTMGNINVLAGYFCVFVPFAVGLFIEAKKLDEQLSYLFFIIVAFMGIIAANADSAIIGLFAALLFLLWFSFKDLRSLGRYFLALGIFFLSAALLGYMDSTAEKVKEPLETLPSLIANSAVNRVCLLVFLLIGAVLLYIEKKKPEMAELISGRLLLVRKVLFIALAVIVAGGFGLFIYLSTAGRDIELGGWSTYLRFSDAWGSSRGFTWSRTVALYGDYLNVFQKLFGFGPELFRIPMHDVYDAEVLERMGAVLVDAHNEFLELLLTLGLAGVVCWYGFIFTSLYRIVKERSCNMVLIPIAAGMVGYIVESMLTSPQTFSTPVFILMTALGIATVKYFRAEQEK